MAVSSKTRKGLFGEFLASGDTLRVYSRDKLVFTSSKGGTVAT